MHKGFFTDVMQQRPALFATMLAFNGVSSNGEHGRGGSFASQASPTQRCASTLSEVQGLSADDIALLSASSVVQRYMFADAQAHEAPASSSSFSPNQALENSPPLETLQASRPLFWDFAEESRRLIFLSHDELTTLILYFGVAIHASRYAHLVNHADVVALRHALGSEAYTYGLVRGRFQLGSIAKFFKARSQGIGNSEQIYTVDDIVQSIKRDGDVALALCMARWPQALQNHACALLGRHISPIIDADDATVRGVWFALKKLLLREVAPQWAPCFD